MAIPLVADRVKETSETTGTGTLDLLGAVTNFLTFVQGIGDGEKCYYAITDGTQFEVGEGTVTAGATDTLSRDTVLQTSNNNTNAINWGSGTKDVFVTFPGSQAVTLELLKQYIGARNVLINGDFRIAQRGTTNFSANGYTLDRWRLLTGGGSTVIDLDRRSFTPGQTSVPGSPEFYVHIDRTASDPGEDTVFQQRVEDVRTLEGQEATVVYYARAGTSITSGDLIVRVKQNFGTGGSPSSEVATNFTPHPSITTAWQMFSATMTIPSISGKTLGTNEDHYLTLQFYWDGADGIKHLDLANIRLLPGNIAADFFRRPIQQELALCQRYYWKSFAKATVPAQNAGRSGALSTVAATGGRFAFDVRFPQPMRAEPSVTTYNTSATNADARNETDSTDTAVTVANTTESSCLIRATGVDGTDAGDLMEIHVAVDAEL